MASVKSNVVDYGSTEYASDASEDTPMLAASCENLITTTCLEETTVADYQLMEETTAIGDPARVFSSTQQRFIRLTVDRQPRDGGVQFWEHLEYALNVLLQMVVGFITFYMSWFCLSKGLVKTALHAWLVTLGFSFLMAEGIMCHYNANVLTFTYKRTTKTQIHWVLQALGGGLGTSGILIKCIQKHFQLSSLHGKLGFATLIFCLVTMLSGLSALFSVRVKRFLSPLNNKALHNLIGICTFVLALLTQYTGYETSFFRTNVPHHFQMVMQWATLTALPLTCIGPLKGMLNKIKLIFRQLSR